MVELRPLRYPEDREGILALDTSFTTERVYRVVATGAAFEWRENTVSPYLYRAYDLTNRVERIAKADLALVAVDEGRVVGVAALGHEAADERAIIRHIYVDRAHRRHGIGRALMGAMVARAEQWRARCLWVETQDVNYDAIQFYKRAGFVWCGLDLSLDERDGSPADETAVFFMRPLT